MARFSPSAQSTKFLRSKGYLVATVEKVVPYKWIKQDLYGFIDLLAVAPGEILGIQATSTSNMNARLKKAKALPALREWLLAGGLFVVHGWSKMGKRGCRKKLVLQSIFVTLEDL